MANYTYESGASFPANGVMTLTHYLDATNEIASAINQIKQWQNAGDYNSIVGYLRTNPGLKKYILSAEAINKIEEETRNVEIFARQNKQQIFYQDTDPVDNMVYGDIWIGN